MRGRMRSCPKTCRARNATASISPPRSAAADGFALCLASNGGERSMKRMPVAATAAASLLLAMAPALAHHAVQAQFDVSKTLEKRGVLVKIDWINPHTYMHFDVTED